MYNNNKSAKQWIGPKRPAPLFRFIILAVIFAIIASVLPAFSGLVISGDAATLCLSLSDGEEFSIKYTHSVNRSPVVDTIERTGETLTIRSTLYKTYGAGIPAANDEIGKAYSETDEGFLLTGIDSEQTEINLLTGTYADHRLIYRQRELILKETFGEKALITIEVQRVSLIKLLIYKI